jgi:hypothetical protein
MSLNNIHTLDELAIYDIARKHVKNMPTGHTSANFHRRIDVIAEAIKEAVGVVNVIYSAHINLCEKSGSRSRGPEEK